MNQTINMENISFYFTPILLGRLSDKGLGQQIDIHTEGGFPEVKKNGIAFFYVPEFRNSPYKEVAVEKFREQLYQLNGGNNWDKAIYDLGDVIPGETINDTYFAVGKIVAELVKNQVIPIIIGGSQDLTVALYKGYEKLEQFVNLCAIDSKLDVGSPEDEMNANGYISHLLVQRPCYLFNHSNIGLQIPFVDNEEVELFEKLYFDYCRLGEFNSDFNMVDGDIMGKQSISKEQSHIYEIQIF